MLCLAKTRNSGIEPHGVGIARRHKVELKACRYFVTLTRCGTVCGV